MEKIDWTRPIEYSYQDVKRTARLVCTDRKTVGNGMPMMVLITDGNSSEDVLFLTGDGRLDSKGEQVIFNVKQKLQAWIYRDKVANCVIITNTNYSNISYIKNNPESYHFLKCVEIEY